MTQALFGDADNSTVAVNVELIFCVLVAGDINTEALSALTMPAKPRAINNTNAILCIVFFIFNYFPKLNINIAKSNSSTFPSLFISLLVAFVPQSNNNTAKSDSSTFPSLLISPGVLI